jgi:hypothetical protein
VPELTTQQVTLGLLIAAAVALLSFLLTAYFALRLRKIRREYLVMRGEDGDIDLLRAVGRTRNQVDALSQRMDALSGDQAALGSKAAFALQRFHMVRYDAFEDMGGRLSFSAALLDDHGDGIVLTSINGRTETRTYAKPILSTESEYNLSEEERSAIAGAMAREARQEARASVAT